MLPDLENMWQQWGKYLELAPYCTLAAAPAMCHYRECPRLLQCRPLILQHCGHCSAHELLYLAQRYAQCILSAAGSYMLLAESDGAHHVALRLQRQLYAFWGRIPAHDGHGSAHQLADLMQHEALPKHHHAHPFLPLWMQSS